MSWGIDQTGTKEGLLKSVPGAFDQAVANYAGKPEADDIVAAKERALALVSSLDLSVDGSTDWNAATVKANGSHSMGLKGLQSANFALSVVRTSIKL